MSEEQATYLCSLSAQELRIGNWVYDGERTQFPMQVVALGKDWAHLDFPGNEGGVWEADIKDLRAIPLTKEFFTRGGFIEQVDCDEYGTYMRRTDLRTEVIETSEGWSVHIDDDHFMSVFGKCIKFVHEFQNAYHVSAGKELEVQL